MDSADGYMSRLDVEKNEGWRENIDSIPWFDFGPGFLVKPIPPFGGAVARMLVSRKNDYGASTETISVYLDWFGRLGAMDKPYWEVYPNEDGDNERFDLDDTRGVARCVKCALLQGKNSDD